MATVTADDPSDWRLREMAKGLRLVRTEQQVRDDLCGGGQGQATYDRAHTAGFRRYWHHLVSRHDSQDFPVAYCFLPDGTPSVVNRGMPPAQVCYITGEPHHLRVAEGVMTLHVGQTVLWMGGDIQQHVLVGRVLAEGPPSKTREQVFGQTDPEPAGNSPSNWALQFIDGGGERLFAVGACEKCGDQVSLRSEVSRGALLNTSIPIPSHSRLHKALVQRPCECWAP